MLKLQRVQNRALKFILNVRWYHFRRMEELHAEAQLEPINHRLILLARKTWNRIRELHPNQYNELMENMGDERIRERGGFRLSLGSVWEDLPPPIYT